MAHPTTRSNKNVCWRSRQRARERGASLPASCKASPPQLPARALHPRCLRATFLFASGAQRSTIYKQAGLWRFCHLPQTLPGHGGGGSGRPHRLSRQRMVGGGGGSEPRGHHQKQSLCSLQAGVPAGPTCSGRGLNTPVSRRQPPRHHTLAFLVTCAATHKGSAVPSKASVCSTGRAPSAGCGSPQSTAAASRRTTSHAAATTCLRK